jgi:predicted MFS family arabinose efflux permease
VIAQAPARRSALAIALAGLVALAVAMGIGRFAFTPILPMMQEDAGVSIATGGWLASANYLGYLAGALSVIWWRIAATIGIRVGLATIGLATLAMGLSTISRCGSRCARSPGSRAPGCSSTCQRGPSSTSRR